MKSKMEGNGQKYTDIENPPNHALQAQNWWQVAGGDEIVKSDLDIYAVLR